MEITLSIPFTKKGIILAGGSGTRLHPVTLAMSKQLLPVYDKPLIYYPISTLIEAGIGEILIITTPEDAPNFVNLLGDGSQWGINLYYEVQPKPEGLAHAFIIGEKFINKDPVSLILGDNIFYGNDVNKKFGNAVTSENGATIFCYYVNDPERYGVIKFDEKGEICGMEEKPINLTSNYAITGLYQYDNSVISIAKEIKPSKRGELEITEINQKYFENNSLTVEIFETGTAWLDTGTVSSFNDAANYIKVMEERQGIKIGCVEEIAYRSGFIGEKQLEDLAAPLIKSGYGEYLLNVLKRQR